MKLIYVVALLLFAAACCPSVNGKRFTLRPISAREVYRVLHEAGRADAIPEGRIVTQGIAAVSGFGAGILKGIGGAALFDALVSNETMQMITNFNTSSVSSLFSGLGGASSSGGTQYTAQEICFSTRSARQGRQASSGDKILLATSNSPSSTGTTGSTMSTQPSGSTSTSTMNNPTMSQTSATSPTTTQGNTGSNTGSLTQTETATGTGDAVNCVVIEKPKRK